MSASFRAMGALMKRLAAAAPWARKRDVTSPGGARRGDQDLGEIRGKKSGEEVRRSNQGSNQEKKQKG
jgi:hypothetical protein